MSLITRCPTCETMFRVVPDQLRVSEGWVRCGQCSEVFDATQNMLPPDDGSPAPTPASSAPAPSPAPSTAPRQAPPPSAAPTPPPIPTPSPGTMAKPGTAAAGTWLDDTPAATHNTHTPASASDLQADLRRHVQDPTPPPPRFERDGDDGNDSDDALAARFGTARDSDWHDATQTDPQTVIEPRDTDDTDSVDTLPPPELDFPPVPPTTPAVDAAPARASEPVPPVSFLHDDAPPSVWQRPIVRIALVVVVVVLLALLAMQFLVKERDRVAAMQPAMRPMLEALCAAAGCSVEPLRQIESIVIDSSSFSRVRGDDYRLGFALKNTAPIDVAMPAIELSLTDPQDEPVIRRVILPSEFGARSAALASASVWTGSLALTVQTDVAAQRIAGYRLLAFYP